MMRPRRTLRKFPKRLTDGDGLHGLPQSHVVGEEQPPDREKLLDGLDLEGVERALEGRDAPSKHREFPAIRHSPDEIFVFLMEQRVERRLRVKAFTLRRAVKCREIFHHAESPSRIVFKAFGDAKTAFSFRLEPLSGATKRVFREQLFPVARQETDTLEPIATTLQGSQGMPREPPGSICRQRGRQSFVELARLRGERVDDGKQMLAQTEGAPEEVRTIAASAQGLDASEESFIGARRFSGTSRPCRFRRAPAQPGASRFEVRPSARTRNGGAPPPWPPSATGQSEPS